MMQTRNTILAASNLASVTDDSGIYTDSKHYALTTQQTQYSRGEQGPYQFPYYTYVVFFFFFFSRIMIGNKNQNLQPIYITFITNFFFFFMELNSLNSFYYILSRIFITIFLTVATTQSSPSQNFLSCYDRANPREFLH